MCSWCSDEQLKLGTYRPGTNHNAIINRVLNLLYSYIRSNAHIRSNNDFKLLVKVICIQHEASDWGKRLKIVGSIENWHLLESNHKWLLGCFYQKANIFNTFFHKNCVPIYLLLGYDYYFYQTDSSSSKGRQYLKILKMCDGPQDTRWGDMNYINKIFGLWKMWNRKCISTAQLLEICFNICW